MESALVVPVPEAEGIVKPFRDSHDPSAALGMPAHITALYPFIPPDEIGTEISEKLANCFRLFPPFRFTFAGNPALPWRAVSCAGPCRCVPRADLGDLEGLADDPTLSRAACRHRAASFHCAASGREGARCSGREICRSDKDRLAGTGDGDSGRIDGQSHRTVEGPPDVAPGRRRRIGPVARIVRRSGEAPLQLPKRRTMISRNTSGNLPYRRAFRKTRGTHRHGAAYRQPGQAYR